MRGQAVKRRYAQRAPMRHRMRGNRRRSPSSALPALMLVVLIVGGIAALAC